MFYTRALLRLERTINLFGGRGGKGREGAGVETSCPFQYNNIQSHTLVITCGVPQGSFWVHYFFIYLPSCVCVRVCACVRACVCVRVCV